MAEFATPWGYSVELDEGETGLAPLISVSDFRALYPTFASTDERLSDVLGGVSDAIRDWCGWHVGPAYACTYIGNGEGRLLMLPSMGVTSVESLAVDGAVIDPADYEWTGAGMVRLRHLAFPCSWRSVECAYTAGFGSPSIGLVAAQIAGNALAAAPGVREEHAGSVGITYNQTGSGISGGVSLLDRDRALLGPYRLARAW